MNVSGDAADLVVKEGIQATESAVKLAGSGIKNVAALLMAISRQDYKVVGKTNCKRLARDPAPAVVIPLSKEDMGRFQKLAKDYGVLYFLAQKKGNESGHINIVSNQNYAPQLNAVMDAMSYPIPQKAQEEYSLKKAQTRAPQERPSPGRGNGSTADKPSVRAKLEELKLSLEVKEKNHIHKRENKR